MNVHLTKLLKSILMYSYSLIVTVSAVKFGDIEYYGSIIIMKSHPEYDIIVDTFNNFVEQLLEKLNS